MKKKISQRLGSAIMASVLLLSILLGCIPALLFAAAAESHRSEVLSVSFSEDYAVVGKSLSAEIAGADSANITYNWTVDGETVSTTSSYTPKKEDLMKWIVVTVACDAETAETQMFFSELPVVYINTENGAAITSKEKYIDAELIIQGNETYNSKTTKLYNGVTEIRGRGNSTWAQPKKPYRLKLDKKTDLFGMGKSKHWVLLANYMDESLQRNTLAYNLSGAMGMEQMSTVYVDVVLNGDFVGNYQLCENIRVDTNRVDIFDWEGFAEDTAAIIGDAAGLDDDTIGDLEEYLAENMGWITSGTFTFNGTTYALSDYPDITVPAITGGYLLELDEYYDEVSKFKTDSNQPIMFKNPEYVNTNKDMMNYVQGYVQAFEDAVQSDDYTVIYDGKTMHYSDLFDMDALVDYWLITEIFFNEEMNKKSTYMYKDIDSLMKMGPIWDMDWSSGADQGVSYHTNQWATLFFNQGAQANQWYKHLIKDPYFVMKVQERYWEIRHDQVADMLAELESNYQLLKVSADANAQRWGHKSFDSYTKTLRTWFNDHLTWMDSQMATQEMLFNSLGNYASESLVLTLTDAQGEPLAADTAKTAPANNVAESGEALKLTVSYSGKGSGEAIVYVNGRVIGSAKIDSGSSITLDIPASALTASEGRKNVLEVQIQQDDYIEASAYITVREN